MCGQNITVSPPSCQEASESHEMEHLQRLARYAFTRKSSDERVASDNCETFRIIDIPNFENHVKYRPIPWARFRELGCLPIVTLTVPKSTAIIQPTATQYSIVRQHHTPALSYQSRFTLAPAVPPPVHQSIRIPQNDVLALHR